jgi:hypothetical protein
MDGALSSLFGATGHPPDLSQQMAGMQVVISSEYCTFKLLNLHMLIPKHCYLFEFVLFYCFQVFKKDARNSIDFGFKAQFEKT